MTDVNMTERALWHMINGMGWWYWGPIAALGAWNVYELARGLAARWHDWGSAAKGLRLVALIGFLIASLSWENTAFGPLALPFVFLSFALLSREDTALCAGTPMKPAPKTLGLRLAALMVERKL